MFDWISGKKDPDSLTLTVETRQRLDAMAQILARHPQAGGTMTPAIVLEKLLSGEISLVSDNAKTHLALTAEGFSPLGDLTAAPEPAAPEPAAPEPAAPEPAAPEPAAPESASPPEPPMPPVAVPAAPAPVQADTAPPARPPDSQPDRDNLQELAALRQQLAMLQTQLNQGRDHQASQQAKISALMHQLQQKAQDLESCQTQVQELRQAAAIGEAQLNRWRFNTYSR
jgi:hypothetical protein